MCPYVGWMKKKTALLKKDKVNSIKQVVIWKLITADKSCLLRSATFIIWRVERIHQRSKATNELFYTNGTVIRKVKSRKKNLGITRIYHKKAYDRVDCTVLNVWSSWGHSYILG